MDGPDGYLLILRWIVRVPDRDLGDERLDGRSGMGGIEGDMVVWMPVLGGDFESEGEREERIDGWGDFPATRYC